MVVVYRSFQMKKIQTFWTKKMLFNCFYLNTGWRTVKSRSVHIREFREKWLPQNSRIQTSGETLIHTVFCCMRGVLRAVSREPRWPRPAYSEDGATCGKSTTKFTGRHHTCAHQFPLGGCQPPPPPRPQKIHPDSGRRGRCTEREKQTGNAGD